MHQLLYALWKIEMHSLLFIEFFDILRFTTKATPSVRPSQNIVYVDMNDDTPLPYSLIANTATQFLGRNLLGCSLGKVYTWDSV